MKEKRFSSPPPPAKRGSEAQSERTGKKSGGERQKIQIEGYKILEKIGQGGMGAVYRARQVSLDRDVAIKLLPPQLAKDPSYIKRFEFEARSSAKLNHVNLVSGIAFGKSENGLYYFIMEYVEGEPLHKRLKRKGCLAPDEVLTIAVQAATALEHAKRYGLVHRDIKPDNLILQKDKTLKITDLGLAKAARATREVDEDEDDTGRKAIGTPCYMSPEQARGEERIDIRADIYALGATLYHLLTGQPLFSGRSRDMMRRHVSDSAASLLVLKPDLSPAWGYIIEKCLAKDRSERYSSPKKLEDDLIRLRDGRTVKACSSPPSKSSMDSTAEAVATLGLVYPPNGKGGSKPSMPAASRRGAVKHRRRPPLRAPAATAGKGAEPPREEGRSRGGEAAKPHAGVLKKGTRPVKRVTKTDSSIVVLAVVGGVAVVLLLFLMMNSGGRSSSSGAHRMKNGTDTYHKNTARNAHTTPSPRDNVGGTFQRMEKLAAEGRKNPERIPELLKELRHIRDQAKEQLLKRQADERIATLAAVLGRREGAAYQKHKQRVEELVGKGDFRAALLFLKDKEKKMGDKKWRTKLATLRYETAAGAEAAWRTTAQRAEELERAGKLAEAIAATAPMRTLLPEELAAKARAEWERLRVKLRRRNEAELRTEFRQRLTTALQKRNSPFGWSACKKELKVLTREDKFLDFRPQVEAALEKIKPGAKLEQAALFGWEHLLKGTRLTLRGKRGEPFQGVVVASSPDAVKLRDRARTAVFHRKELQPEDLVVLCGADAEASISRLEQHMAAVRMLRQLGLKQRAAALLAAARKLPGAAQDARLRKLAAEMTKEKKEKKPPVKKPKTKPEAKPETPLPPPPPAPLPNFDLPPEAPAL